MQRASKTSSLKALRTPKWRPVTDPESATAVATDAKVEHKGMAIVNAPKPGDNGRAAESFIRLNELLNKKMDITVRKLEETAQLTSRLQERETKLYQVDGEIETLRREIEAGHRQSEVARAELKKAAEEAKELRLKERSLAVRLQQTETENAALRKQLSDAQARAGQIQSETNKLSKEVDAGRALIQKLEREKDTSQALVEELRLKIRNLRKAAASEIGRIVRVLLEAPKSRWKNLNSPQVQAELLVKSNIIDPDWYLSSHKDVAAAGVDPVSHYISHGAQEGREANNSLKKAVGDL